MPTELAITRQGQTLVFRGALTRPTVATAWREASALLDGAAQFDIEHVSAIDSAGIALLAALTARAPNAQIIGQPAGFAELRQAYRLNSQLQASAN